MNPDAPSVEVAEAMTGRFDAVIDARTPTEFAEDHIPGAVSAPVLDDAERAEVGTLYKQVSQFDAKKLGAALVARNVARHVERQFAGKPRSWRPLVYCWRGGKRSGAMAHILREIGWEARTLAGGYRAYRRWALDELAQAPGRFTFTVIHGPTGSGKSRLLAALGAAGAQTLDLEGLAAHRGSVLGTLPGQPQPAQKLFDSRVLAALRAFDPSRRVFAEGESKKIGQIHVPDALIARMRASECVRVDADVDTRVSLLLDEYRHFLDDRAGLEAQLDCLVALHGRERIAEWKALAARGGWRDFVCRLLLEHYDPAYQRSATRNFPHLAEARVVRLGAAEAAAFAQAARSLLAKEAPAAP
jgi:tRNA 2-selenouridine synthase